MSLTINTNLMAINASRNLNNTETMLSGTMQRLSSGLRINSAADDVAGYAISQSLQAQVNGLNQAGENIQDAVALAQTAQGALNDVNTMLQRIRELGVEYANGTTSKEDQEAIISEVSQLVSEIKRVGETTQFNGKDLLSAKEEIKFQVGANDGETIGVTTIELYKEVETKLEVKTLGERLSGAQSKEEKEKAEAAEKKVGELTKEIKEKTETYEGEKKTAKEIEEKLKTPNEELKAEEKAITENAGKATGLKEIDEAIAKVSSLAGEFGSVQDRIQFTQSNLEVYSQNLTSAVSALQDVNMAMEMTQFTKDQVLQQAGVSILAQANHLPDAALKLLE
jgi:flagellin